MAVVLVAAGPAGGDGRRRGWRVRWRLPVAPDDGQDRPAPCGADRARWWRGRLAERIWGCSGRCRRPPPRRAGVASGSGGPGCSAPAVAMRTGLSTRHRYGQAAREQDAGGWPQPMGGAAVPGGRRPTGPGCAAGSRDTPAGRRHHAATQRPVRGTGCRPRRPLPGRHAARCRPASHTRRWAVGAGHRERPAR